MKKLVKQKRFRSLFVINYLLKYKIQIMQVKELKYTKGVLMQIWKSTNIFVFTWI